MMAKNSECFEFDEDTDGDASLGIPPDDRGVNEGMPIIRSCKKMISILQFYHF